MLATAGAVGVELWDIATGGALGSLGGEPSGDVAFSPTEPVLAFVHSTDRQCRDLGRRAAIAGSPRFGSSPDFGGEILGLAVAFSPDGRTLATSGLGQPVHVWDVAHGEADAQARSWWVPAC